MDAQIRKQLLLTRIALDRVELRYGTARVRQSVGAPLLWRALFGADIGKALFGGSIGGGKTDGAGWLRLGLTLLRRYRLAATVLGSLGPLLGLRRSANGGRRSLWRRAARLAAIGTAAWFGWRVLRSRGRSPNSGPRANPEDAT